MSDLQYNPFDREIQRNPYPVYARLRAEAPVFEAPGLGFFAVSRYRDVAEVLGDAQTYSSSPFRELFERVARAEAAAEAPGVGAAAGAAEEEGANDFRGALLGCDPPLHTRLRKIVNRGFTRSRIAALAPRIEAIARDLLAELEGEREWDLMRNFAVPLPSVVIAELLGIEPERRQDFRKWSDALLEASTGLPSEEAKPALGDAIVEFGAYLDVLIEKRRSAPERDLISALVHAEGADAEVLDTDAIGNVAALLLVAGNETTTNLIANGMLALLAHPEECARVQADPARIPAFVEETLRYDSPLQLTLRRTTRRVRLAGTRLPEGATLACLIGSANHDPARFPEPERFDPDRDAAGHLAFGKGHHFCLGAALSRLEARIAFEALFARFANFELGEGEIPRAPSLLMRGVGRLPIRCDSARGMRRAGAIR